MGGAGIHRTHGFQSPSVREKGMVGWEEEHCSSRGPCAMVENAGISRVTFHQRANYGAASYSGNGGWPVRGQPRQLIKGSGQNVALNNKKKKELQL